MSAYGDALEELKDALKSQRKQTVVVPRRVLRTLIENVPNTSTGPTRGRGRIPEDEERPVCHDRKMHHLASKDRWQCPVCLRTTRVGRVIRAAG